MYGNDSAELYDLLHSARGKDFEGEAAAVAALVGDRKPDAASLLDIACGTGAHLARFAARFPHVEGVELSEPMLDLARARLPGVPLTLGDMRDFDLGRRFDAAVCLFGSLGYVDSADELDSALRSFARHLNPGGVLVVEPWWAPDTFTPGHVSADVVEADGTRVARVSHASLATPAGDASLMRVHYVVAHPDHGIRHFAEDHVCRLFDSARYEAAFTAAGLAFERVESPVSARGFLVGVRK
ncbi:MULTISPECIES: trans-aconitate 2-methyltransferase [Streptomyces]|uniref:class I SAM-dependent methyltransferase n=1 Tax=Streptomyces TaxID=1883 RepID=UPI0002F83537|nr:MULTISPECIES: class I SAM-dependent methyltransferase [Streptomyces]MYR37622.1 methyltransferase domain-containing protein [Streptomyces sp. SID4944]MBT3072487.1 class I SAM-dependent methyltransferase [Streptomyces sp. COG21]MBT3080890.1 class I SAM-dependent methyltransferase [Streptomyces sp. COG20]MBT3086754.1 class I SAM-dependent methyltransferase [Streptomyces sp. CYG21]MBT3099899.1 class I SAM-dependent methyltransferase [Streptomyces sp. CBG30]